MPKRAKEETEEEVAAAALAAKKAAKKAKKAAEAAAAEEEEEEAPKKTKKSKKAAVEEEEEEDPEAAALAAKKAAKKAKKAAAAAAAAAEEEEEDEAPKKTKKSKKAAAEEEEDEEEPVKKKEEEEEEEAPAWGKGKGKGKSGDNELTVFVRGLPFATTEDALRKDFAECGEVTSCRMPLNDEGSCKGIAFIAYADKAGMDKALAFNETDYGGRTIYCSPAADKPDGKGKGKDGGKKGKGGNNELTVFVRGLPFATTEDALRKDFAECGEVTSCRMLLNDEGSCRGLAFIAYADKEGMDKALAFNETDYGGRTIYCSPAADKPDGKGKGKDGKDGKGKGKKGKKGKAPSEAFAKSSGAIVESTGKKQTFADDSDDE